MRPTSTIIPRDVVAEKLAIAPAVLIRYENRGLVHTVREGAVEGYSPAEVRRIWTILTFQRDLGINLAGVETILKLRDQMAQVHRRLDAFASELRELIERDSRSDSNSDSDVETDA
ncbi:chaperone modulator CbpM [Singulisphaera sp. Ch08]|uniref:Chaperone modulator CbpM n=1 Tax=Singulisphaera sp. Ch08 TaxID=3120278 RepID=A0AAU7CAD0_9BACT